jgi:hypothetical protein
MRLTSWSPDYERHRALRLHLLFKLSQSLLPDLAIESPPLPESVMAENINTRNQEAMVSGASLRMHGKRMVMSKSKSKFAGLAPWRTEAGDIICVLRGCSFPVMLRPIDDHFSLVGEIYVDDFMDGQALLGLEEGKYALEKFELR